MCITVSRTISYFNFKSVNYVTSAADKSFDGTFEVRLVGSWIEGGIVNFIY